MKHTIDLDVDQQWAVIRYHGPVRPDDPVTILRTLAARPGWTPQCDRIVVYDDGQLGDLDAAEFRRMRDQLIATHSAIYGEAETFSAQVCRDPMQIPLVAYWISFGNSFYPAGMQRFDTVEEAKAWLCAQRPWRAG